MPRVKRVLEAAAELSSLLTVVGIVHAFHGGFLAVLLGSTRDTEVRPIVGPIVQCAHRDG